MDTSGGRLKKLWPQMEPSYSVAKVAKLLDVDKQTVYKWLEVDDGDSVIPVDGWFKLPGSGYIRIKRSAVMALQKEM